MRFEVVDQLAGQNLDLIPKRSLRRDRRWAVVDTTLEGWDRIYAELSTKRTAELTARDLNQGLYGPLSDEA